MLMPDPLIWVPNFPVEREVNSLSNSYLYDLMCLLRGTHAELLFATAALRFLTVSPTLVALALSLASAIL